MPCLWTEKKLKLSEDGGFRLEIAVCLHRDTADRLNFACLVKSPLNIYRESLAENAKQFNVLQWQGLETAHLQICISPVYATIINIKVKCCCLLDTL